MRLFIYNIFYRKDFAHPGSASKFYRLGRSRRLLISWPERHGRLLLFLVKRRVVLAKLQAAPLHTVGGPLKTAASGAAAATVRPIGEPPLLTGHNVEPVEKFRACFKEEVQLHNGGFYIGCVTRMSSYLDGLFSKCDIQLPVMILFHNCSRI